MEKFVVIERDGLFYEGEIVRVDAGRNLDGKRVSTERVVVRGEGDWLRGVVEQRVAEKNQAEEAA